MQPIPPRARRFSFTGAAELIDLETGAEFHGLMSDLSLDGCHVEIAKPVPTGLGVKVSIVHRGVHFVAVGKVANVRPPSGVGITFTHIEPAHQVTLDKWLSESRSR